MTVIDVGSNIGQFTIFSALLVGSSGSVHGFEPAADSFKRLRENTSRLNHHMGCVQVNRLAAGKENREIMLHIYPPGCSAWNSLNPHTMFNGKGAIEPCRTEKVRMTTLDDYCRSQKIGHIDLLKVDVEGFEVEVLEGCRWLIEEKRIDNIIFEISLETLKGTHWTGEGILNAIREMGCDVRSITSDGSLERVKMPGFNLPYFANYLATPLAG
jgi:FkbM family methyltransferase